MAGGRDTHPAVEELLSFLRGELPPRRVRAVVAHLAAGCADCRRELAPAVRDLLFPEPPPEAVYEIPVRRVLATGAAYATALAGERAEVERFLLEQVAGHRPELPPAEDPAARDWAWHERALMEAEACRGDDPESAVEAAALAVAAALRLDPQVHGAEAVEDAKARSWAELGNARRAADDFEGAEEAFVEAVACFAAGSGELRLQAQLLNLLSSLRRDQRRFDEATHLLKAAHVLYLDLGEPHLAGRMLVQKGLSAMYAADTEAALVALAQGLALIDHERDPSLTLAAVHNLIRCQLDLGRHEEAARLLWRCRRLYEAHGAPLDLLRRRWLEARAAAGLGRAAQAERGLAEVRAAFARAGLHYDAALVALDLSAFLLDEGRPAEVVPLVDEMLVTFRRLGIGREAAASVLVLRRALAAGEATAALARAAALDLQRSGPPTARRTPEKGSG